MNINSGPDLSVVPVQALRKQCVTVLSTCLNPLKVIPNKDGLPRDWRGLAHLAGMTNSETNQFSSTPDPMVALISKWKNSNLKQFQEYLEIIDRYDALDDTAHLFEEDAIFYLSQDTTTTINCVKTEVDQLILTVHDVERLEKGMEPQIYDAFILFDEEDTDFATQIIETMENKYSMKFCVRDRDLIGGITFEHEAIMKLIAERCRRLIVIVSKNFLKSKANKFFVTFAQALGIDQRERKVVPILYEKCELPPELSYYFLLDYSRAGKLWNFWDKLRDSIQAPDVHASKKQYQLPVSEKQAESSIWMSRTSFEKSKEQEPSHVEEEEEEVIKNNTTQTKKNTKLFKKLNLSSEKSEKKEKHKSGLSDSEKKTKSVMSRLQTSVSNLISFKNEDTTSFKNLDNSSSQSFEESPNINKNVKESKKQKLFKKRIPMPS